MSTPQPWFDAFFNAVTSSPEFAKIANGDLKKESLASLEEAMITAENALKETNSHLQKTFSELQVPKNSIDTMTQSSSQKKDDAPSLPIEVKHFKKDNPLVWWFAWIAGMDDLKKELTESFVRPLQFAFRMRAIEKESPEKLEAEKEGLSTDETKKNKLYQDLFELYEKFKVSIPTGLLFYGPPGTGKTYITKKLTEELWAGFISKNMGEFGSSYQHQTTKNIKEFFDGAKLAAKDEPIVLFLDEIDSLVSSRTTWSDAHKAEELSQFLQEFNALSEVQNLIVIAATNRPDHLDSAILRSGRLDKKIYIWPPDFTARRALFEMYISKLGRPSKDIDYDLLATKTEWYVSADIETICDEVARDVSQRIFDLFESIDTKSSNKDLDTTSIIITMDIILKAINDTPSSLLAVDMSIYGEWEQKI